MVLWLWRWYRSRACVWGVLGVLVLCWLYVFPAERRASQQDMLEQVLTQGPAWQHNHTAALRYRKLLAECCEPRRMFALTKENAPLGTVLWYDGEFYHYHTVNNHTHSLFIQDAPLQRSLKRCAVVGNGGVLKHSRCGADIDQHDFIMRCNLPPLSKQYVEDVGTKTHLVTANPSIVEKRFDNLLWSRRSFVESMASYGSSLVYVPAFSMAPGTGPSLRAYHALADARSPLTVLFAHPDFLRRVGRFWTGRGVHAKRLSTGLFLVSLALGLCDEVTAYGFWPFSVGVDGRAVSHHYYDNVLPFHGFHAMPDEFSQLWNLHKAGAMRVRVGACTPSPASPPHTQDQGQGQSRGG